MSDKQQPKRYVLRLYEADRTGEMQALANRFEEFLGNDQYQVEVIDVIQEPERAIEDRVFVTPTMLRALPEPVRQVIGDVSDPKKTLLLLGLFAIEEGPEESEKPPEKNASQE